MFCIHRYYCIKPLCCICMTWNCYVNLVCVSEFSNLEKCVSSIDYLSWLKKRWAFIFFFFQPDVTNPESPKNTVESSVVNGGLTSQRKENGLNAVQRKKLLKAPTLAELDSSDSEVSSPEVWVHKSWLQVHDGNTLWPSLLIVLLQLLLNPVPFFKQ